LPTVELDRLGFGDVVDLNHVAPAPAKCRHMTWIS
jgi:hypothetical protein